MVLPGVIWLVCLVGCAHAPERNREAAAGTAATEQRRSGARSADGAAQPRLRGPHVAGDARRARSDGSDEHPHPEHPRRIDAQTAAADDQARLRRDFARGADTPVLRGLLHAHTCYSDGSGTPTEAFERARAVGLDFLAVTEHNHASAESGAKGGRRDGVLVARDPRLYDAPGDVSFTRRWTDGGQARTEDVTAASLARAAHDATDAQFIALIGQEYSTISSGNHVNVIDWPQVLALPSGDFAALYGAFGNATPVLQLNHPDVRADLFYRGADEDTLAAMFNDYGFDDFDGDFTALVEAADPLVALIELVTGPAMIETAQEHVTGAHHERDYYYYLVQGLHLSPSVGHDNHYRTWGDATPARMGVFAAQRSREALLAAMRANRTFASEDPDLRIDFSIGDADMGDVLTLAPGSEIRPRVRVEDPGEPDRGYVVELIYGDVQAQARSDLVQWEPGDGLSEALRFDGDAEVAFDTYLASGLPEFFYVRVTQDDRDRAWSAPIWINHPRPRPSE